MPIRPDVPEPAFGEPLPASQPCADTLRLLARRRSAPVALLDAPGPDRADLEQMIRIAARAPDHRKLGPWRFLVFTGDARTQLGEIFASACRAQGGKTDDEIAQASALPLRAPAIVTVISAPVDDPKQTPKWEQELSAGAVCQNLLIAACASGWAASWISEWPAFDADVAAALGLASTERIAGFIYIGTAKADPVERQRPEISEKLRFWGE